MSRPLHFDYASAKRYCEHIDLVWLGDEWLRNADNDAWAHGFTQEQMDIALQHHLWQTKWLFMPENYKWYQRWMIAFYFITGWKLPPRNS